MSFGERPPGGRLVIGNLAVAQLKLVVSNQGLGFQTSRCWSRTQFSQFNRKMCCFGLEINGNPVLMGFCCNPECLR